MTVTKSHTHCQSGLAAHIQSLVKNMVSVMQVEQVVNEMCPTA